MQIHTIFPIIHSSINLKYINACKLKRSTSMLAWVEAFDLLKRGCALTKPFFTRYCSHKPEPKSILFEDWLLLEINFSVFNKPMAEVRTDQKNKFV